MQGSTFQGKGGMVNAGQYLPGIGRYGKCREVPSREREGGIVNAGEYLPEKGRHGECTVVVSREREAWFMEGNNFRGEGGIVNAGQYLPGDGTHSKRRVVPCRKRKAWEMMGSTFHRKGGMVNAGWDLLVKRGMVDARSSLPAKGRHGQCRVVCGQMGFGGWFKSLQLNLV